MSLKKFLPKIDNSRKQFVVQWHLTSKCTGNCRFCYMMDSPNYSNELRNELSIGQCLKIIDKLSSFFKKNNFFGVVLLTGGNPLLKEGLGIILDKLSEKNIKVMILGNPDFIDHQVAKELYRKRVGHYQLSIDGVEETHDYFRGKGSFKKTWQAVDILKQHNIEVGISTTLSRKNYLEIEKVIDLCANHKVDTFRPSRLTPQGKGKDFLKYLLNPVQYRETISRIYKKLSDICLKRYPIYLPTCDPLAAVALLDGSGELVPAIQNKFNMFERCYDNILAILPEGTVYFCSHLPLKIGNILENSVEELVDAPLIRKIKNSENSGECVECGYLKICRKGCPAITHALTNDFDKKDPSCWVNLESRKIKKTIGNNTTKNENSLLFAPLQIGSLRTKNRIFRSATFEGAAELDGSPTEGHLKIYKDLVLGECGLITTGLTFVSDNSQVNPKQNGIHEDYLIEKWKEVTDKVHGWGGKIAMQLTHQNYGWPPLKGELFTPSIAFCKSSEGKVTASREMTEEDILLTIKQFRDAAIRVKEAGFDAVQLQLVHGYLLGQFVSPFLNKRTDSWGGSLENRSKIITQIVEEIRRKIGKDYPIIAKINSSDFVDGGMSNEEASDLIRMLSEKGITAFELSGALPGYSNKSFPVRSGDVSGKEEECYYQKEGESIKRRNPDAIIGICGGIRTREKMEELLDGGMDFVALSRPFVREPDLVKKIREGREEGAECVSCSLCYTKSPRDKFLNCFLK